MTFTRERHEQYSLDLYGMRDICLVRGKGAWLWDEAGKKYLDCMAGHGVANIGHCPEKVVLAIQKQAAELLICPNTFYHPMRALLQEKLISLAPASLKKVFLCNSGTESIEAALKFTRASTKKTEFITAMRSFHGRTFGALSATFNPKYKEDFLPLVPGFHSVPFNQIEKLKAKINENTAGILLEIVQGEGGVYPGTADYFQAVQQICREQNILLLIDEVQTGFCRTGKFFACEHFGLEPDLLCLAKAVAGGLPMGAVLCSERIHIESGKHGTTFGGNPLACAAALASIEVMQEEGLALQAETKGKRFLQQLGQISSSKIREIRGLGLMIGIELKEKSAPYLQKLLEEGILALPAGSTVIRLLPPLMIEEKELDWVSEKIAEILRD